MLENQQGYSTWEELETFNKAMKFSFNGVAMGAHNWMVKFVDVSPNQWLSKIEFIEYIPTVLSIA